MAKKVKKAGKIISIIAVPVICFFVGFFGAMVADKLLKINAESYSLPQMIFYFAVILAALYASVFLQIIIHEAGHLVFGLISGYKFSSFRIGSFILIKKQGKLRLCRFWLNGTAGQCLLAPPEIEDGKMPFVLYNLGGVIFNFSSAVIAAVLAVLLIDFRFAAAILIVFAFMGLGLALANGIPVKAAVPNDGHNALSLGKSPAALKAVWQELTISAYQADDIRLQDMPEDLFYIPKTDDQYNTLAYQPIVYVANEMLERGSFESAAWIISDVINKENALADIHKRLLTSDFIFCKLMMRNNPDEIKGYLTKKQIKAMKQLKTMPAVLRSEYAIALLLDGDTARAEKIKVRFEKIAKNYAYSGQIQSERELMNTAREVYENGNK